MRVSLESSFRVVGRYLQAYGLKDDRPRPSRMKKPKVTPGAHRVYKEYTQDLFQDMLTEKYGTERAATTFEWFINNKPNAIYTVGQEIQDEKAQMFLDLGEKPPADYWSESYFDVWTRWMNRPKGMFTPEETK